MSHRSAASFAATLLALVWATHAVHAQKTKVESQVLLTAEPGGQFAISPKGQHVAGVVLRGSRQVMVHDGVDGPRFDEILTIQNIGGGNIIWNDDGSRFAYFGRVGQEFIVVVDGKEAMRGPWSAELATRGQTPVHHLAFTPRGKHWYAILHKSDPSRQHYQLIIDGIAGPVSQEEVQPVWSPDGEHHAYIQTINPSTAPQARQVLIVDAKPAPYLAGDPQFTGDGLHLFTKRNVPRTDIVEILADGQPFMRVQNGVQLYMAPTGPGVLGVSWATPPNGARAAFLTIGNRRVPGSECADNAGLSNVYISNDAKHFAARCKTWIMVNGKKGQEYADGVSNVAFTADGKPVYQGRTNGKSFVIVGDQESDGYGTIVGQMEFTRAQRGANFEPAPAVIRGNHVGFMTRSAQGGNATFVVVDGKKYPTLNAQNLTLSPDGSRFAVLSGHPYHSALVDGTAHSQITVDPGLGNLSFQGTFQWTSDSKHVAWLGVAPTAGVAINGKFIATGGMTRFLKFTADGRHLVWIVRAATGHQVFVDGVQVLELPQNLALENEADIYWSFAEDGSVTFVAQDGDAMKRFRITPGADTSVETLLAKAKTP